MAPAFDNLPKQFVVSESTQPNLSHFWRASYFDWNIYADAHLPIVVVKTTEQEVCTVILGWVIWNGQLCADEAIIEVEKEEFDFDEFYDSLCGRFVLLYKNSERISLFTDAGALLPVVYHRTHRIIASTPAAISNVIPIEDNTPLRNSIEKKGFSYWYPFGLTPYVDIARLMPNQKLDLNEWQSQRVWPTISHHFEQTNNSSKTTQTIANQVLENVHAIVNRSQSADLHLTAGYDSRMIAAACQHIKSKCQFQTIHRDDQSTELDCYVADKIAKHLGLNHTINAFIEPAPEDVREWMERTSYCVRDSVTFLCSTVKSYDNNRYAISGLCGEVARSYYWPSKELLREEIDAAVVLKRLKQPTTDLLLSLADTWLNEVAHLNNSDIWDLAYIEQRLGGWGGPSVYGHQVALPSLSPFNSRGLYKKMLSLPVEYRSTGSYARDFMMHLWPETLSLPFNRAIGRDRLKFFRAELRDLLSPQVRLRIKKTIKQIKSVNPFR